MSRVLVLHASSYGQTRAVAIAVAARLRERGHVVELADAGVGAKRLPPPEDYDGVVIGSRVEFGHHAKEIAAYVERNRERLGGMPTAFFSVSLWAGRPDAGHDPGGFLARFFDETDWRPTRAIAVGGALPYRKYGWFLRLAMQQMARLGHHSTDTSRDHEYTDWAQVARFADDLAQDLLDAQTPLPTAEPRNDLLRTL